MLEIRFIVKKNLLKVYVCLKKKRLAKGHVYICVASPSHCENLGNKESHIYSFQSKTFSHFVLYRM